MKIENVLKVLGHAKRRFDLQRACCIVLLYIFLCLLCLRMACSPKHAFVQRARRQDSEFVGCQACHIRTPYGLRCSTSCLCRKVEFHLKHNRRFSVFSTSSNVFFSLPFALDSTCLQARAVFYCRFQFFEGHRSQSASSAKKEWTGNISFLSLPLFLLWKRFVNTFEKL